MRGGRSRRGQALRQRWVGKTEGRRAAGRAQRRWHGAGRASVGFGGGPGRVGHLAPGSQQR